MRANFVVLLPRFLVPDSEPTFRMFPETSNEVPGAAPIPTLPVLVLLMFPLPSGVVHCAFAATVASRRITTVLKSLAIELGRCLGRVVVIFFFLIN